LEELPGTEHLSAVDRILVYLDDRLHTGGRRAPDSEGHRWLSLSALDSEIGHLRAMMQNLFGTVQWDPQTLQGNPALAGEISTFRDGAAKTLADKGITVEPAMEAYEAEIVQIVQDLRQEAAALQAAGKFSEEVWTRQIILFVLTATVWGDRAADAVSRDFEHVRVIVTADDAAAAWPATGAVSLAGAGGVELTQAAAAAGGYALVTYINDKGSKLAGAADAAALRTRVQAYPVMLDTEVCPILALEELKDAYRRDLAIPRSGIVGARPELADTGPIMKAYLRFNNKHVERVLPNTFERRVNDKFKSMHNGKFKKLTSHSFRRGFSQMLQASGAEPARILKHFRWRQLATASRYLARRRDPGLADPVASQPGCTQGVADLRSYAVLAATAVPPVRSLGGPSLYAAAPARPGGASGHAGAEAAAGV